MLRLRCRRCGGFDGAPARYDVIVGARILGPARSLAKRIKAIGKLPRRLGFGRNRCKNIARTTFTLGLEDADQVM